MKAQNDQPTPGPEGGFGSDLLGAIKHYGPLAALLPAIILARGRGGQEVAKIAKRFAPKHFDEMARSSHPYIFSIGEPWQSGTGPQFTTAKVSPMKMGRHDFDRAYDLGQLVKSETGKTPKALSTLDVSSPFGAPDDLRDLDLPGSAMHEFGHGVGFERARQRFPQAAEGYNVLQLSDLGQSHLDILDLPKSREIMKSGVKSPHLREYLEGRLVTDEKFSGPGRAHHSLGEFLNELWAERMLKRGGHQMKPVTQTPAFDYTRKVVNRERQLAGPSYKPAQQIEHVAQHGTLPPADHAQQLRVLDEILRFLRAHSPEAPAAPARPSPPKSPAAASAPGSPAPARSRSPR